MSENSINEEEYHSVGKEIIDRTLDKVSGRNEKKCIREKPQDAYFISNISPKSKDDEQEEEEDEGPFSEANPSMIGIKTKPSSETLITEIELDIYLRTLPNYTEYRDINESNSSEDDDEKGHLFRLKDQFFVRKTISTSIEIEPSSDNLTDTLEEKLNDEIKQKAKEELESRNTYPSKGVGRLDSYKNSEDNIKDQESSLSEEEFNEIVKEANQCDGIAQEWKLEFEKDWDGEELLIKMINSSSKLSRSCDPYIFNPEIRLTGDFHPYQFRMVPEDFRYDRKIWSKGINASTDSSEENPKQVFTTAVPRKQTWRFSHREEYTTDVEELGDGNLIQLLEEIQEGMWNYYSYWLGEKKREFKENDSKTDEELEEFKQAAERFKKEIKNYEKGLEVLKEYKDSERAFRYMNKAFKRQDNIPSWHLFQLVFIVSNIPSVVAREHHNIDSRDDEAEVLWFPTGGGKTEAYLGLIIFTLFFDRIRGKEKGVSSWIRFPLTLLGKQQLSRFLDIMLYAEEIREEELTGEEFSIGYYVGGGNTPNKIQDKDNGDNNNYRETFPEDKELLEDKCKVIDECPKCEGEVDIEFNEEKNTVHHFCKNEKCDVGEFPLYVTDHEIYRNIPSVLLGTLDKIAVIGSNPRFTNLLGNVTTKCPRHGYGYSEKCPESGSVTCNEELEDVNPDFKDPIPTLHLVDEVHLLGEELGVFAGHYETFYLRLCKLIGDARPKVVTSTATISDSENNSGIPSYEQHMKDLFMLEANRFPEEGPSLDESFYGSITDEKEREFIGLTPNNKTHIYAVLNLVKKFHETVLDIRDDGIDGGDVEEDKLEEILLMYELSLIYFLRKTEKDRFMRSVDNQIQREMERENYSEGITIDQLTADKEGSGLLDRLEHPEEGYEDRINSIAATSYIGHGIDVDRFNNMFFFGFPSRTFQYIQTSSRVGRDVPGFVIDVFEPADERDKHRYKYFLKSHEYLDRTVEDISVDRWSKFSLDKTFPGIFKGLLIQYYRPLMYREHNVNVQSANQLLNAIDQNDYEELSMERYQELLKQSYKVNNGSGIQEYFRNEIEERVEDYWQFWWDNLGPSNGGKPWTTFRDDAMRSLRDIGEEKRISIKPEQNDFYGILTRGEE